MRHRNGNKKLGKPTDQRLALLRNLVFSLIKEGKIKTTHLRAMQARRLAEKLVTLAKEGSLASRRRALQVLPRKEAVATLFGSVDRFKERQSGFTRVIKLDIRRGDAAQVSLLEFVD